MILIACVDENLGMMFNHRRQSMDRAVRKEILKIARGHMLWMNAYSCGQFSPQEKEYIREDEAFPLKAARGDWCFFENISAGAFEDRIETIVLFQWNRVYPADFWFDIPLSAHGWKREMTQEFAGFSHEKITKEIYRK